MRTRVRDNDIEASTVIERVASEAQVRVRVRARMGGSVGEDEGEDERMRAKG